MPDPRRENEPDRGEEPPVGETFEMDDAEAMDAMDDAAREAREGPDHPEETPLPREVRRDAQREGRRDRIFAREYAKRQARESRLRGEPQPPPQVREPPFEDEPAGRPRAEDGMARLGPRAFGDAGGRGEGHAEAALLRAAEALLAAAKTLERGMEQAKAAFPGKELGAEGTRLDRDAVAPALKEAVAEGMSQAWEDQRLNEERNILDEMNSQGAREWITAAGDLFAHVMADMREHAYRLQQMTDGYVQAR